jgi:phage terminase large subunit-like protein
MPIKVKNRVNYIALYTKKINEGKIIASDKVIRFYNMLKDMLDNKEVFYNDRKAKKALVYIENFCHHHEGELAPGLIELELWQKAAVSTIFGIVDKDGYRQYTEVFIVAGRKIGKTLLAAAIANYCTFADNE